MFPKVKPFQKPLSALLYVRWKTTLSILDPPVSESVKNGVKKGSKKGQKWSKKGQKSIKRAKNR